jgi:hypothetical protein
MQRHKRITEEGTVHYTRLYADADGESHFEDAAFAFNLMDFAPSAPPVHIASFSQAKPVVFLRALAGFDAGHHQAPVRQLVFVLAGVHEITASDADVVRALLEYDGIRHACAAWGRTEDSEVREVLGEFGSDVCGKINESLKAVKNF